MTLKFIGFRKDLKDLFAVSGLLVPGKKLKDSELMVITPSGEVKVLDSIRDLDQESDDTDVLLRWPGKWTSDTFHFTVKEYKDWVNR